MQFLLGLIHGFSWVLLEALEIFFSGWGVDFCPHSIIPVTCNPEYYSATERSMMNWVITWVTIICNIGNGKSILCSYLDVGKFVSSARQNIDKLEKPLP